MAALTWRVCSHLWELAVGLDWMLVFGRRQYGRPTTATAKLLVMTVHVCILSLNFVFSS